MTAARNTEATLHEQVDRTRRPSTVCAGDARHLVTDLDLASAMVRAILAEPAEAVGT